jgi:hypothetical protein
MVLVSELVLVVQGLWVQWEQVSVHVWASAMALVSELAKGQAMELVLVLVLRLVSAYELDLVLVLVKTLVTTFLKVSKLAKAFVLIQQLALA